MILYALEAKDNCGKTTTLKKLLLRLLQAGARPLTETDGGRIAAQLAAERSALARGEQYETADVTAVLEVRGIRVGIATDGSTPEATADALDFFREGGCKVCFFAVRSKGAVQAMLEKYARKNTVYRVEKAVLENAQDFPAANRYMDELNDWQSGQLLRFLRGEAEK